MAGLRLLPPGSSYYFTCYNQRMTTRPPRRGQNTVEYLLMLTVVVGVVLAAGYALRRWLPGFMEFIKGLISGAAAAFGK